MRKTTAFLALILGAVTSGCAMNQYVDMSDGPKKRDAELSGIISSLARVDGVNVTPIFVGADGKLCPPQSFTDDGPLPKHFCANLLKLSSGKHTLLYHVQTPNQIQFSGGFVSNSWSRSRQLESEQVDLAAGTLYRGVPYKKENGAWSVRIVEICRTSDLVSARIHLIGLKSGEPARCP